MVRSSGGGGGGVAFSERRRAYGPGASRWGGGRLPFVSSGARFLLVIGGVWVTVLVLFSTAFYADTHHASASSSSPSSTSWSFLGGEEGGSSSSNSRGVEGTGLQALQSQVDELSQRVKALSKQQERPPLEIGTAAAEAAAEAGGAGSEKKGGSSERGQYAVKPQGPGDTSTSERPLVDPTVLARSRPAFAHDDMGKLCGRRNNGDEEVLDRVQVWDGAEMGKPRILCLTYTLSKSQAAVEGVRQTWGQRCDGYIAMSDVTDKSIPSVDIKHDGPEAYENMWQVCMYARAGLKGGGS